MTEAGPISEFERQTAGERVATLYSYLPITLAGNGAGAMVVTLLFWNSVPRITLVPWMCAFWLLWALRALAVRRFDRLHTNEPSVLAWWYRLWAIGTLVSGALWGATVWLFYDHGGVTERVGLLLTVYSLCVAAIPIFAPQRRIFDSYAALCFIPMVVRIGLPGNVDSLVLAGVLLTIFSLTVGLGRSYRVAFENVLRLKVRADQLMGQLRAEKTAAEVARQDAEVANRAKTQFFAAASHDLRQPLHAMGLFAEALRQRSHDEEVSHLVASINGSVDALEGLFSELLDITRIDTGGVDVTPEHFNVGEIFRRLRLHFEPVAFEKGLALRFRGGEHHLHADPLLVERILRNLVSNAIRYTGDGTVLVSCRRRNGSLLVQVWDTGVGIRDRDQTRVFEEFYQVSYSEALPPQQSKGLGLGLAIVKRLAGLMQAPLRLRSVPGRGTVFSLELPVGKAPRVRGSSEVRGKASLGLTLERKRILVVEDEPAVRAGLEALLKGWGAEVVLFDTVAASRAWAANADLTLDRPDLLIVDYRLEQGHTGVEAIQVLRDRFGVDLPAIMVTGSTMTGHDAEAQENDFHLLVKPVVPNKLRAMIGFKLGMRAATRV